MRHIIRPAAREDILRQYRYYAVENKSPAGGERFLAATQVRLNKSASAQASAYRRLFTTEHWKDCDPGR